MKYLEIDDEDPEEHLEDILCIQADDLPESPYPDLDLLYHQILRMCPLKHWDEIHKVLRLVVTIPNVGFSQSIFPYQLSPVMRRFPSVNVCDQPLTDHNQPLSNQPLPCSIECIAAILSLKPGKVRSLLIKLHAVLEVPDDDKGKIRIPHATFSEFLLDPQRSTDHHVEPHTKSEYCDLVAQVFLRTISVRSQEYWHHVHNSTIAPRRDQWRFISTGSSLLCVFDIVQSVVSPSAELLAALNEFDPYPFVAAPLHLPAGETQDRILDGILRREGSLMCTIQWAKSLSPQVPQKFIDKMEGFTPAFYVVPASSTLWEVKIYIEERLYISGGHGVSLWSKLLRLYDFSIDKDSFIFVVPADLRPPPSWQIITITREKADAVDQLLGSLLSVCGKNNLMYDIYNNTNYIGCDSPNKQHDLHALKELVAQCREEKDLIRDNLTHNDNMDRCTNLTANIPKEHKFTKVWRRLMLPLPFLSGLCPGTNHHV
ncbi:hypothetical protein VNI00_015841 [Paramarasmius palmivorus]|uniref:Uncharacterized protein n=1 Tax=Paramarasmius palmivorus TaxID=297713 RepID=A0AAW0BJW7_9AGAR